MRIGPGGERLYLSRRLNLTVDDELWDAIQEATIRLGDARQEDVTVAAYVRRACRLAVELDRANPPKG